VLIKGFIGMRLEFVQLEIIKIKTLKKVLRIFGETKKII
jgi:hypothetical protein